MCDADGVDEDCSAESLGGVDADGDGFVSAACRNGDLCGPDCDDTRRDVFPGATELCNAVDDDCDGEIDGSAAFCPAGICVASRCQSSGFEWVMGGPGQDESRDVATDDDGNVYGCSSRPDQAA